MKLMALFDNKGLVFLAMILIASFIAFKAMQPLPSGDRLPATKHVNRYR